MKDKAEGKPTPREIRVAEVKKKKEDFIERNYNQNFKEQQKVFDEHRARKLQLKESENTFEKFDPPVWRATLALMKYQTQKDQFIMEDQMRADQETDSAEADAEQKKAKLLEEKRLQQQLKAQQDRPRKKKEARGISVKIKLDATDENDAFKRQQQKSEEEVTKSARRLVKISERQELAEDKRVNDYFIRIQKKVLQIMKMKPGLESERSRQKLLAELKDGEHENKLIGEQIISKHEEFIVERIIDDILVENVHLLQMIEKKQKLPKKQVRTAILEEYKQMFIGYFDDSQTAMAHLGFGFEKQNVKPPVRHDAVLTETGKGLLVGALDARKAFKDYVDRNRPGLYEKDNVARLNIIARDIAEELIDSVVDKFDDNIDSLSAILFQAEFDQ